MSLGRRLLARVRRIFGYAQLWPIRQLQSLGNHAWRSIGNDPQFACGLRYPLAPGWYLLRCRLQAQEDMVLDPMFYVDFGHGMSEGWSIRLPFLVKPNAHGRGIVLLPHGARQLRLDPASRQGMFALQGLRLHRVSRVRAACTMFLALLARQSEPAARWRLCGEVWPTWRDRGARGLGDWLHELYRGHASLTKNYAHWLSLYDIRPAIAQSKGQPLISIVLPVYNTPERWLRQCIESVRRQTYAHWELCIADDASESAQVHAILREYAAIDPRIRITWRTQNGHISAASNSALEMIHGQFVALLDHDDELHPEALREMAMAIEAHPEWLMIYSDEDKIDVHGERSDPYFKPDWNRDLLLGQNCISHLGVYATSLLRELDGFRQGFEGSQDWDLVLRCAERLQDHQIGHVPKVLYHWRSVPGSTAQGVDQKSYAHGAAHKALQEHFARRGVASVVQALPDIRGVFRVSYPVPQPAPKVSLIVPTRDRVELLRQCVSSILALTTYPNYEVVIVDNQSCERATFDYFDELSSEPRVRLLRHDLPFNYSRLNNAAVVATDGALIGLINNDIEVITPDWLEEMVGHACRPEVGAVGAMLYYPDNTIQHAGVIIGIHGVAGHPYSRMPRGYGGQMARARLTQTMTAVTAACMVVRREIYQAVGGLDEQLQIAFNDIDLCLRIKQAGYRNVWTPFAELYHHESASRGYDDTPEKQRRFQGEVDFMLNRWHRQLQQDPCYNPNLCLSSEPFALAFPPRV
jgi:GT2 family glycosyltransferase